MFKRLIIYFYRYKNGGKQENCGYGKLNINEGDCRIEINIKDTKDLNGYQNIYLYTMRDDIPVGTKISEVKCDNGKIQFKYQCRCNEMVEDVSFENFKGILIFDGKNLSTAIAGDMRENEVNILKFVEKKDRRVEEIRINEVLSTEKETIPQLNVENSENLENSVYEYDEECLRRKAESQKETEEIGDNSHTESQEVDQLCSYGISMDRTWQEKIFNSFPKVILRINGEQTVGVKLRPHDVTWFPGTYWRMATNKFLLNGYYNYRYILFFRGTGDNSGKFYIGTPGCFGVSDAIVAKKYGFTDFFSANGCNRGECSYIGKTKRNFGFWCCKT